VNLLMCDYCDNVMHDDCVEENGETHDICVTCYLLNEHKKVKEVIDDECRT
jgi:hypothetical protein